MLKFFKRQKSQHSTQNDNDVAASIEKRHSLLSTSSFCDDILEEDSLSCRSEVSGEAIGFDDDIFNYHSRLSMSLTSILKDTECITCFVQYLEAKNALPIIKFYLDTENFKISALEQLVKKESAIEKIKKEALLNNDSEKAQSTGCLEDSKDKKATNNVPELKTLCDLSMHKPLTDDEKSQIYAETNKQISSCTATTNTTHKLKSCSELSLFSVSSLDCTSEDAHSSNTPHVTAASIKDALAIYQKYLSPNSLHYFELPVNVLSDISLVLCKRQEDESNFDEETFVISPYCFDEAQQYVLNQLERLHLNEYLQSPYYCKYCLELIMDAESGGERLSINDILYSEVTLFFFMEFLEQQGERECLDFWTAAINFRKSYAGSNCQPSDPKEVQEDAMIIYKKFFSLQSEGRLWMSDKLRCRVEACICASPEQIGNCFDLALVVTAKYLEKKYFSAFLNSDLFAQYVNELRMKINESQNFLDNFDGIDANDIVDGHPYHHNHSASTLQHKLSFKGPRRMSNTTSNSRSTRTHRKTLSDCTNDITRGGDVFKYISQHNTLLAMDTSSMHLKNLQSSGTSMSIDARQLTNPNLLWHRKNSHGSEIGKEIGGLKFGYVNALGRYERDFETIDCFNNQASNKNHWSLSVSGNKIKNAMRKLVNLPEHKAQEEIAWQIAEMIVKDVTSVTLKNKPTKNDECTTPILDVSP